MNKPISTILKITIVKYSVLSVLSLIATIFIMLQLDNIVLIKRAQITISAVIICAVIGWIAYDLLSQLIKMSYKKFGKIVLMVVLISIVICSWTGCLFIGLRWDMIIAWRTPVLLMPVYFLYLAFLVLYLFLTPAMWNMKFKLLRFAIGYLITLLLAAIWLCLTTYYFSNPGKMRVLYTYIPLIGIFINHLIISAIKAAESIHGILGNTLAIISAALLCIKGELNLKFSFLIFLIGYVGILGVIVHMGFYTKQIEKHN